MTRRLIIKVGSALLYDQSSQSFRAEWLSELASDIAMLREHDIDVAIVSSGAIALGCHRLGLPRDNLSLPQKQACAATGQVILTQAYEAAFAEHGILSAQILLTLNDTENRRRWLNARATLSELIALGIVPIINENDTVATDEIRYGDNDRLAARTAQMTGADTLILLSDINGLYTEDPRIEKSAQHIEIINKITPDISAMGGDANAVGGLGSGGMATKLMAAQIATQAGCSMCIMDGRESRPIKRLLGDEKASWFQAARNPKDARRQWIMGHLDIKGTITIDDGALTALKAGKSLLAAGITAQHGEFIKGDTVSVLSREKVEVARGIIAYNAAETEKIAGRKSSEFQSILGYDNGMALIHRDNLVMTG
ncbi:MAG: glutamate 5-kinase [Hellea sp.]|nr:glutamate 5-kinase [Hellea sp.]